MSRKMFPAPMPVHNFSNRPNALGLRTAVCAAAFAVSTIPALPQTAADVLRATGLNAGLVCRIGSADGQLEADLAQAGNFVVHGIALTPADRDKARAHLMAQGVYGLVAVENASDFKLLPYGDNTVNLFIADLDALGSKAPAQGEIERALAPNGYAYTRKGGAWNNSRKPMPSNMDGWPHYWHNVSGTAASRDMAAEPPNALKWVTGNFIEKRPGSPTTHNTQSGYRADGGKVFYNIWDGTTANPGESKPTRTHMVVRDAFSGVPNWRYIPEGGNKIWAGKGRFATVMHGGKLYTNLEEAEYTSEIDIATGEVLRTFDKGLKVVRRILPNGKLNPEDSKNHIDQIYCHVFEGVLYQIRDSAIVAIDLASGNVKATYIEPAGRLFHPVIDPKEKMLYAVVHQSVPSSWRFPTASDVKGVVKVSLEGFQRKWFTPDASHITQLAFGYGKVYGFNSGRGDARAGRPSLYALDPANGKKLWEHYGKCANGLGSHCTGLTIEYPRPPMAMVLWNNLVWLDEVPVDPETGKMNKAVYQKVPYNSRCHVSRASGRYIAYGFNEFHDGMEIGGSPKDHIYSSYAARSACSFSALPAYGHWFFSPTGCGCILNKLDGFLSLYRQDSLPIVPDVQRLEKGDDYMSNVKMGSIRELTFNAANDALKQDMTRTDFVYAGDSLTVPVTDGSRVYVSIAREHRLEARSGGKTDWSFTAGGRISVSPLLKNGKLWFGSHDGWVYCLNASDGKLLWRFLAAPGRKKIFAHGQIESAWPVYGVTLYDDQVAFAAGRNAEVDGGMMVYSVNAATGAQKWKVPVSISNVRVPEANTSKSRLNTGITYDGSAKKLNFNGILIDPANPVGYVQGREYTVHTRETIERGFAAQGPLPLQARAEGRQVRVFAPVAGAQHIELIDMHGRVRAETSGMGPNLYLMGSDALGVGNYMVRARSGETVQTTPVTIR